MIFAGLKLWATKTKKIKFHNSDIDTGLQKNAIGMAPCVNNKEMSEEGGSFFINWGRGQLTHSLTFWMDGLLPKDARNHFPPPPEVDRPVSVEICPFFSGHFSLGILHLNVLGRYSCLMKDRPAAFPSGTLDKSEPKTNPSLMNEAKFPLKGVVLRNKTALI